MFFLALCKYLLDSGVDNSQWLPDSVRGGAVPVVFGVGSGAIRECVDVFWWCLIRPRGGECWHVRGVVA